MSVPADAADGAGTCAVRDRFAGLESIDWRVPPFEVKFMKYAISMTALLFLLGTTASLYGRQEKPQEGHSEAGHAQKAKPAQEHAQPSHAQESKPTAAPHEQAAKAAVQQHTQTAAHATQTHTTTTQTHATQSHSVAQNRG